MKKTYKMRNLDCANCAARMEEAIRKLDGVAEVNISFLTQKLTIQAEEARLEEILKQAVKACRRVDPDCEIVLE